MQNIFSCTTVGIIVVLFLLMSCSIKEAEGFRHTLNRSPSTPSGSALVEDVFQSDLASPLERYPIQSEKHKTHFGLYINKNGLGDQSFNDMQYKGLMSIKKKHPDSVEVFYKEAEDYSAEAVQAVLRYLADTNHCEMVFVAGFETLQVLDPFSIQYPATQFVVLDSYANLRENISCVTFAQNEGSFVVGALSALMSTTKNVGFIGGVDVEVIKDFEMGFRQGIRYIDKKVNLFVQYISSFENNDLSGFSNPDKGNQLADSLYSNHNVDIIYSVAGMSGNGVIEAARARNKYVIGVDSDQDHIAKGLVLTSMMKRLDWVVEDIAEQFLKGKYLGKTDYYYTYKNGGVSISPMNFTRHLISESVLDRIRSIEKRIIGGKITVKRIQKRQGEGAKSVPVKESKKKKSTIRSTKQKKKQKSHSI